MLKLVNRQMVCLIYHGVWHGSHMTVYNLYFRLTKFTEIKL